MKMRPIAAALLLAFIPPAIGLAPNHAHAQQADDPSTKAARARFQEGVTFYDKGEYENARAAFLQAYALRKHPAVLLNLAQSSLRSGHFLEAAKSFQQYLRDSQNISPAQRSDAERGLSDARQKIGRIDVSAPTGTYVTVDGEGIGTAPLSEAIDVESGSHRVRAGNDEVTVSVQAGQRTQAKLGQGGSGGAGLALPPPAPSPAPASTPRAPETAPLPEPSTNASSPETAPSPTVDGGTGGTAAEKQSIFAPPATMVPVYVGGGIALTGFIVALVVGVAAKNSAQSAADSVAATINAHAQTDKIQFSCSAPPAAYRSACSALADNNNKVNTDAAVGNVGLAVGIAGTVFAAGWYLLAPKRTATTPETAPVITPIVGAQTNGLAISGSF